MKEKEQKYLTSLRPPSTDKVEGYMYTLVHIFSKWNFSSTQQSLWAYSVLQKHQVLDSSLLLNPQGQEVHFKKKKGRREETKKSAIGLDGESDAFYRVSVIGVLTLLCRKLLPPEMCSTFKDFSFWIILLCYLKRNFRKWKQNLDYQSSHYVDI